MATKYGAATAVARTQIKGWSPELRTTLDLQRDRLASVASNAKLDRLQKLYESAVADLESKLRASIGAGRGDTFTALQQRVLLAQVRQGQMQIAKLMAGHAAELSHIAQVEALRGLEQDVARLEKTFTGAMVVVPTAEAGIFAGIVQGRRKTLLEQHQSSMNRWGAGTVDAIAEQMSVSMATGESTDAAISRVAATANADFWKAERIVRTEVAWAHNATLADGIDRAADELGDVFQRWVEFCDEEGRPLDDRVAVDSIAMHGQLARPAEQFFMPASAPFPDAEGKIQVPVGLIGQGWPFPPNRPNDRAVLQPWRPGWGLGGWVYVGGQRQPYTPDRLPPRARRVPEVREEPKPEEAPPPAAALTADVAMAKKVGEARGSNPGGFYEGSDGVRRYVKLYDDPEQAQVEHLAGNLYRDLGLPAPTTYLFDPPAGQGQLAFASDVLPGFKTIGEAGLTTERAKELTNGFVADVLLGNWDVMGLEMDNVGVSAGKVYRIDNGSALWFRARGGVKEGKHLFAVSEFDGFFDPTTSATYARVLKAAGIKQPEDMRSALRAQMAKIRALRERHGGWGGYVDRILPNLAPDARQKMIDVLEVRTNILGDYCDQSVFRHTSALGQKIDENRGSSRAHDAAQELARRKGAGHADTVRYWIDGWTSGGRTNDAHLRAFEALEVRAGAVADPSRMVRDLADAIGTVGSPEARGERWQAFMRSVGAEGEVPTHVEVFRGVGDGEVRWTEMVHRAWMDPTVNEIEIPCDAAASFSRSEAEARKFSASLDGAVLRWRAPIRNVIADQIADDGSLLHDYSREREVIAGPLRGGLKGVLRLPKHEQVVRYKGTEYTYADRQKLADVLAKRRAPAAPPAQVVTKLALTPAQADALWANINDPQKTTAQLSVVLADDHDAKMNILLYKVGDGKKSIADYLTKQGYPDPKLPVAKPKFIEMVDPKIAAKPPPGEFLFATKAGVHVTKTEVEAYLAGIKDIQPGLTTAEAEASLEAYWPGLADAPGYAGKLVQESATKFVAPEHVLWITAKGDKVTAAKVANVLQVAADGGAGEDQMVMMLKALWPEAGSEAKHVVEAYLHGSWPPILF